VSAWHEANQRWLSAALADLAARLRGDAAALAAARTRLDEAFATLNAPPALDWLVTAFGLTAFERDLLLLCAGVELDTTFAEAALEGAPAASFGRALAALSGAHWSALSPSGPLRTYCLIGVGVGATLARSPLRVEERVLHFITGVDAIEPRLAGVVDRLPPPAPLPPSHEEVARRVAAHWSGRGSPVVFLSGGDVHSTRAIVAAAAALAELRPHHARAADLGHDRDTLNRLWTREALLTRGALLIESDDEDGAEVQRRVAAFIDRVPGPLAFSGREAPRGCFRPVVRLDVNPPPRPEQEHLWRAAMERLGVKLNGSLPALLAQFRLSAERIEAVTAELRVALTETPSSSLDSLAWKACRVQSRARLDGLAQRIEPAAGWEDLVLPADETASLRAIVAHQRQRDRVYESWGFAKKGGRGLGLSALFAGQSGTGKTMAAEVLARELQLDLYRIDLSQVVSKYIGETEKNLRRVFDAAEDSGALLLFDEADALFGKRSEVRDSHDRYANIEVSYLLTRMESYRGVAILTTNLKDALDKAFLRRLRFIVNFPFPGPSERARIWERIFPADVPRDKLDLGKLARLSVAGGSIRNIALSAAFLAADAGVPVQMKHILSAAKSESAKNDRPFLDHEVVGWI
jgi:hypothetical protein